MRICFSYDKDSSQQLVCLDNVKNVVNSNTSGDGTVFNLTRRANQKLTMLVLRNIDPTVQFKVENRLSFYEGSDSRIVLESVQLKYNFEIELPSVSESNSAKTNFVKLETLDGSMLVSLLYKKLVKNLFL